MKLKKTHMNSFHRSQGHLTTFAGFEHALWYEGVIPEHLAVRNAVGLFDVGHMGRCTAKGIGTAALLDYLLTRDISSMRVNQGHYTVMCNNQGGIIDDLVVFRLREDTFFLVYNASNREKSYKWISSHAKDFNVQTRDVSDEVAMFALQGPKALATLRTLSDVDLSSTKRFWGRWVNLDGVEVLLTRSGYTGEDGFEVYVWGTSLESPEKVENLWQTILKVGEEHGIKPCGLGARDTLRLEAGMCLYGNDINENTTPLEAKLTFAVRFEKADDFIGKGVLLKQKDEGLKRIRVGLRMLGRGIPRRGYEIFFEGEKIGHVTSGTFSPLLQRGIGMGYILTEYAAIGNRVDIKVRKSLLSAEIVETPFYDTTRYGWKRKKTEY
jgi:aminomethyltransferase